jgi:hypothetical protein
VYYVEQPGYGHHDHGHHQPGTDPGYDPGGPSDVVDLDPGGSGGDPGYGNDVS